MPAPPDELTNRLLDAAVEVFAERGYERAGVAEIARRAGVTTGAIYSRYAGKAELLLDAIDRRMPAELSQFLAGGAHPGSATEWLANMGADLVDPLPCSPLMLEALVASRRDPELAERMRSRMEDETARLAKLFEEAKAAGLVDPALDTEALVTFAHAVGMGMNISRALGNELPDPAAWNAVITRVIAAAVPPSPSPHTTTDLTGGQR